MNVKQIVGIVLVVLGIALVAMSNRSVDSTYGEKIKRKVTGNYPKETKRELIGGIIFIVAGVGVFLLGRKKAKK